MKRWYRASLMGLLLIFLICGSALGDDLTQSGFIESNFWQGDFLILNLGDWPENVTQKIGYLQKNGAVQVINQSKEIYATSFLEELVTFKPFFYQNELYKIEISFPERFSLAQYDTTFKEFLNNTLRAKLVAVYGPVNSENPFPDKNEIMNYLPFADIFNWSFGLTVVDAGVCVDDGGLFAKVSIYDIKNGMKALLETEQKELEEIKRGLEALRKSAQ